MTEVIFNLNQVEREAYIQNVKDRAISQKLIQIEETEKWFSSYKYWDLQILYSIPSTHMLPHNQL